MKKILLLSLLFIVSVQIGSTQSLKQYIEAAESAYADKDYYSALSYFKEAHRLDDSNTDLLFKIAESARKFNSYTVAEAKYTSLLELDTEAKYPMATYWLAEMKHKQGKYDEAMELYNTYIAEFGGENVYFTNKADKEMKACEWSKGIVENPDDGVNILRLGTEVNTPYSEFSGVLKEDELHYASMQFEKLDDEHTPSRHISKIMTSKDGALGEIMEGGINSDIVNTGNISYSSDGKFLYYTICDYINTSDIRCDIYYRTLNDGNYGEPVKLPDYINSPDHTSTQPAIAHDKSSNMDLLFFVSDREGGKGKMDIWYTKINEGMEFSEPMNVSEINTPENEITPYCHQSTSELYFSSDGYQGLGGYDVYFVSKQNASFSKPTHVGPPTNSSYNDIYYTLNDAGTKGYLSSNRKGSLYLDTENEGCCYDIYKLDIEPIVIDLLALTFDKSDGSQLFGSTVKLYDAESDELLATVPNELGYEHKFELERNRCYYVVAEKLTFNPDRVQFCTNGVTSSETITKKLFLERNVVLLDVFAFDKKTGLGINGCTFALIDNSDRTNIVTNKNPNGNDHHFTLVPGGKYTLIGTHPLYGKKTLLIDANDVDDSGRIIKKVYFEKGLNLFLPLVLYFDNDRPGRRSQTTTTSLSYTETYNPYIVKKREFMKKGPDAQSVGDFFDVEVKGNYKKLKLFLEGLTRALGSGESLDIVVKGYASPRAPTEYNLKLGQRRVWTLKNEINNYGGGVLKRYISSGQLRITDVSLGENTAPSEINDQYKNEKLSVYSVEASKERRIEILKVNKN